MPLLHSPRARAAVAACALLCALSGSLGAQAAPSPTGTPQTFDEMDAHLDQLYKAQVEPGMLAAVTDGSRFVEAVGEWQQWVHMAESLGFEKKVATATATLRPKFPAILKSAMAAAVKRCFTEKDPTQADFMMDIAKMYGEQQAWAPDEAVQWALDGAKKCRRFELVFTSYLGMQGEPGLESVGVKAIIPIQLEDDPAGTYAKFVKGEAPITHTAWDHPPFSIPGIKCAVTTSMEDSEATVIGFRYDVVWDPKGKKPPAIDSVFLWLAPGEPTETLHICGAEDSKARWLLYFQMAHAKEASNADGSDPKDPKDAWGSGVFKLGAGWKRGTGAIFLRTEYVEPTDVAIPEPMVRANLKGKTTLEIRHTPVP